MKRPLHPVVLRYLRSVQSSKQVGLHGFFRRNDAAPRSARTVYRWQRRLGNQLLVVPNIAMEDLGLRHAHVFVTKPDERWFSLPYALEAAVVTPDLCREVLYLRCLVPAATDFSSVLATYPCEHVAIVWSGSGVQTFLHDDGPISVPVLATATTNAVVRNHPFVIPAVMELWTYPNSLPLAWTRIHHRLGPVLKQYLPRTKIRHVNGKTHLTTAFHELNNQGLVKQQLIRYHPLLAASVEVFMTLTLTREATITLLEQLRHVLHATEVYPMSDGYWCRLLGPHQLLDAIINLTSQDRQQLSGVYFHTKRQPTPVVRFQYETLFDPKNGAWRNA